VVSQEAFKKHSGRSTMKRKVKLWKRLVSPALVGISLILLLAACGQTATKSAQTPTTVRVEPKTVDSPDWIETVKKQGFRSQGAYIAAEAIIMGRGLYGESANEYYEETTTLLPAITYWKQTCQNADGSLCNDAKSGNLQCVAFVTGVFASIDNTLPYIGDANQFWKLYQGKAGWQEIAANAMQANPPALGDLLVLTGGSAGHIAVVVDLQAPVKDQDGYVIVAQANAPAAFEKLTWHANGQIDVWSTYQFQGLIRQQEIAPCLQVQVTAAQQQWVALAMQTAVHYGTPVKYFLRQLCQSGFQAEDAQGHPLVSSTGAIGIAQLPKSVAANVPRCLINFTESAQNCDQMPGSLPAGVGIDPAKPAEAIPAAASVMAKLYQQYHQNKIIPDDIGAYTAALAAYNAGSAAVDAAVATCKASGWLNCLDQQQPDHHTRKYVSAVLGKNV
jgi:hypothetical protein